MAVDVWRGFRQRVLTGDPRAGYIEDWKTIADLLSAPLPERWVRLHQIVNAMDEAAFTRFHQTIVLLCAVSWKQAGLADISDQNEFARRFEAYFASDDPEAKSIAALLEFRQRLEEQRKPLNQQPYSEEEFRISNARTALFKRQAVLTNRAGPGNVTEADREENAAIIREYEALFEKTPAENRARRMLEEGLADALEAAARLSTNLNHFDEAGQQLREAARHYDALSDTASAQRCRGKLEALTTATQADIDQAVRTNALALLTAVNRLADTTSLRKAEALVGLLQQSIDAGDLFEAKRLLAESCAELRRRGYPEPPDGDRGIDSVIEAWVSALPPQLQRLEVMVELTRVVELHAAIEGARLSLDPIAGSASGSQQRPAHLLSALSHLDAEATRADAELDRAWTAMSGAPLSIDAELAAGIKTAHDESETLLSRVHDIAGTLRQLYETMRSRAAAHAPLDDLLDQAQQLAEDAQSAHQPAYLAMSQLLCADLSLGLNRFSEALAIARDGRAAWNRAFHEAAGTTAQERVLDVEFLSRITQAYARMDDHAHLSAACGEAIELVERDRYKVSSPYQQSAFLNNRALIYRLGIFAAFKLGDVRTLLERTELVKGLGTQSSVQIRLGSFGLSPDAVRRARRLEIRASE